MKNSFTIKNVILQTFVYPVKRYNFNMMSIIYLTIETSLSKVSIKRAIDIIYLRGSI